MSSSQTPPSNETETPQDAAAKPATQADGAPFRRGQIVWGRPPQAVFRAGPLPRDEGLARLLAMPPHPQPPKPTVRGSTAVGTGNSIAGGSNIPQGRTQAQSGTTPAAAKPAGAPAAGLMSGSLVPGAGMPRPQAAPAQNSPQITAPTAVADTAVAAPVSAPSEPAGIKVDSVLEPVVASSARRARPVADVADDVSPDAGMTQTSRKKPSRLIMAATAALVIAAGGAAVWWSQKSHPDNPQPATEAVAPAGEALPADVVAPIEAAPVAVETATAAAPQSVPVETAAPASGRDVVAAPVSHPPVRTQPAPFRSVGAPQNAPAQAATAPAQATTQAPIQAPVQAQPPVVVVAPPAETVQGPPPTAAAAQQNDPDAPVVTRPQKLD